MRKSIYIPVLMMAAMLSACHSSKEKMFDKGQENLEASLDYPKQLELIAHTEPDSAFGVNYFTRKEITGMLKVMDVVTKKLMKSTTGINDITKADAYTVNLMRRQMNAANEVQTMIFKNVPKGDWSGWKVKIDYECVDKDGIKYRAERWIFFDREGENIIKTFEIPLP
jgi:PBP1b-binding outer membrane lipoprotein LpoB